MFWVTSISILTPLPKDNSKSSKYSKAPFMQALQTLLVQQSDKSS